MRATLESLALFLEREAGYHTVSFSIIILGVMIADAQMRVGLARDLVLFGLGVLSRSMGGKPQVPPGSTTVTSTATITETPQEPKL